MRRCCPDQLSMLLDGEVAIPGRDQQDVESQIGRLGTAIAPLKPRGTVPNSHLADAFDHSRAFGSAAANNIGQRGCAHPVLDSRTEAALSRTPAPRIRKSDGDVRSLLPVWTAVITG